MNRAATSHATFVDLLHNTFASRIKNADNVKTLTNEIGRYIRAIIINLSIVTIINYKL